jgi:hypothetical protein
MGAITPEQLKIIQRQWELQDRAFEMAQAAVDRQLADRLRREQEARDFAKAQQEQAAEDAQRAAQYNALQNIAEIYTRQAADVGGMYDRQAAASEAQRQAVLQQLADAVGRSEGQIGSAQEQLLKDLVEGRAYQDVPLVELGQIANPLMGGLEAEGASTAGVQAQTEQDRQMAAQLAALTRGATRQLNVGEQNYLTALRNAGALSAQQARSSLAATRAAREQGVRSQFDAIANEIAQRRLQDISGIQAQAAEARGQAGQYAPIERPTPMPTIPEPAFDYAAELAKARAEAEAALRASLPRNDVPTNLPDTTRTITKNKKKKTDPFSGAQYDPNEFL